MYDINGHGLPDVLYDNNYPNTGNNDTREFYSQLRIARSVLYPVDMRKVGTWPTLPTEPVEPPLE